MKIPFVIISRKGRVDTIHQTTPETKEQDLLNFVAVNFAGESPTHSPSDLHLKNAAKSRLFVWDELVIQVVDVDVTIP